MTDLQAIAEIISKILTGREYRDLDTTADAALIMDVFRKATVVRLLRMGIKPGKWITGDELEICKKLAGVDTETPKKIPFEEQKETLRQRGLLA